MDFHDVPWIAMDFHDFPWISMDFHRFLWISMDFHGHGHGHGRAAGRGGGGPRWAKILFLEYLLREAESRSGDGVYPPRLWAYLADASGPEPRGGTSRG